MKRGWLATVTGCGLLLVLIAVFAITTQREARRIYADLSTNDATIEALEVQLTALEADMYLDGIYVRNRLIESQSGLANNQRENLHRVHNSMEQRLQRIAALVPAEQAPHIARLRQEIDSYWSLIAPVADGPVQASVDGYADIRSQLRGPRDNSLSIAREIGRLNRISYQERHTRIETAQAAFLKYVWTMMGISLAVGVMVLVASGYIVRALNSRAERNRQLASRAESELRQLSSELFQTQEQERRLLSRELHDEVGQTLTALGMEIGNVENLYHGPKEEFNRHIDEAMNLTQETMKTVRRLSMGLRPAMLDDSGLVPAVRYQAREFSRHSGISSTVEINGSMDHLPEAHRTCVYRVVQEALTNCGRHAKAKNVLIRLRGEAHSVSLSIADDGVGLVERSKGLGQFIPCCPG